MPVPPNGVLHRFTTLTNPQRVSVGAWSHGGDHDASPYQREEAGPNPPFRVQPLEDLCLLERHLRGRNTSRGPAERLLVYFTMGAEQWNTTPTWPPQGSETQRWYFATGGALMREVPTADDAADRYAIDFQATTGTKNRWMTNHTGDDVVYGDRETADRRLLTYTSAPLAQEVEITGQPVVALHVSSTHTDGAVMVNVEEGLPDGYVRYLTGGQLRAIHRMISAEQRYGVTEIPFELMPVSVVVRAGHRLRVAIAGADADTFRRVPEEGVPIIAVYRDATHSSYIALPVAGR